MPVLIPEILEEIFLEVVEDKTNKLYWPLPDDYLCFFIDKFILSGKKPMEIALAWFSHANKIEILENFCVIENNGFYICFVYDCGTINPVIKAVGRSVTSVIIGSPPAKEVEDLVLDAVINDGLQKVKLHEKLPQRYMDRLRTFTSIVVCEIDYRMSYDELFFLRPKEDLKIKIPFPVIVSSHAESIILTAVKKLKINSCSEYADITLESLKKYMTNVNAIFPNLQKISIGIYCDSPDNIDENVPNSEWKNVIQMIKDFDPNSFSQVLPNIQKTISMTLWISDLFQAVDEAGDSLDEIEHWNYKAYEKEVEVENLKFSFSLDWEESVESYNYYTSEEEAMDET